MSEAAGAKSREEPGQATQAALKRGYESNEPSGELKTKRVAGAVSAPGG
jgi:hypothetical protein